MTHIGCEQGVRARGDKASKSLRESPISGAEGHWIVQRTEGLLGVRWCDKRVGDLQCKENRSKTHPAHGIVDNGPFSDGHAELLRDPRRKLEAIK